MNPGKPAHIGVIMDGNRRWARRHRLQSLIGGHREGAGKFIELCTWCIDEGVRHLTVYAFSTENWNRPPEEVADLMKLLKSMFVDRIALCMEKNIRVRVAGNRALLTEDVRGVAAAAEERTRGNTALSVNIALSYGGRDEILRAARSLCRDAAAGKISAAEIDALDEAAFAARLDTAGAPDIDLVIRTGGQSRLSNFFPWQTVYSELVFVDALWPDFSREMFAEALARFAGAAVNMGR